MPKPARKTNEVAEVKDRILQAALQLIIDDGFVHFSMRNLAAKLGMTAANIYNYFTNKDEIYLLIQTRGFEMLARAFQTISDQKAAPHERIEGMMRAYLTFGMENPEYYEIMFSRNTPKYTDYVGTSMEPVAFHEKATALEAARIVTEFIASLGFEPDEARFRMIQFWSVLNGIVNLTNSRVLQEVEVHTDKIIDRMVDDLLRPVLAPADGDVPRGVIRGDDKPARKERL